MEKIVITIETGNAAFTCESPSGPNPEVSRILRDLADRLPVPDGFKLRDINGNTVGTVAFDPAKPKPQFNKWQVGTIREALKITRAIADWFKDGESPLHAGAQLFDDEITIKARCLSVLRKMDRDRL